MKSTSEDAVILHEKFNAYWYRAELYVSNDYGLDVLSHDVSLPFDY